MTMHYLPQISIEELKSKLLDPDEAFWNKLSSGDYERLGLDRALLIAGDMLVRSGKCGSSSILDVGCNSNLIGNALAALGNSVLGIDNGIINTQGNYEELDGSCRRIDFLDFLREDDRSWDYMLLLSIVHHWESGYAMSGKVIYTKDQIRWIFSRIRERTKCGVYLELPLEEPGFRPEFSEGFLKEYCGGFSIVEIDRTVGPNGFLRRLYFLGTGLSAPAHPRLEKILRMAHLFEKFETARQSVPRGKVFELENALRKNGANDDVR